MLRQLPLLPLIALAASAVSLAQSNTSALAISRTGEVVRFSSHISAATAVGWCGYVSIGDLTRDPLGRFIASSGGSPTSPASLIQIDPTTGAGTLLGTLSIDGEVLGLAAENDDTLLALVRQGNTSLYRVDLRTISVTFLTPTGFTNLVALTRDLRGRLLAWDAGTTPTNGQGLVQLSLSAPGSDLNGALDGGDTIQALSFNSVGNLVGVHNEVTPLSVVTGTGSPLPGSTTFDLRGVAYERGMSPFNGALTIQLDGTLGRFNSETGAVFSLGSVGMGGFNALTRGGSPARFIAARAVAGGTQFFELDPDLVTATPLATIAQLTDVAGLAYTNAAYYAVTNHSTAPDELWTLSPDAGTAQSIGLLTTTDVDSLASALGPQLIAWDTALGLVAIDRVTAAVTDLTPAGGGSLQTLAMNGFGRFFAANETLLPTARMFELDITSGLAIPQGSASAGDIRGMDFFGPLAIQASTVYCTAQVNSAGCTPSLAALGIAPASLTHASGFRIEAGSVIPQKAGILFYGRARASTPFLGGTLCVAQPLHRTPLQTSTGGGACGGRFSFDFNAWIASGADSSFVAGEEIHAQWWSRDPASPSTTNLTNGITIEIAP